MISWKRHKRPKAAARVHIGAGDFRQCHTKFLNWRQKKAICPECDKYSQIILAI